MFNKQYGKMLKEVKNYKARFIFTIQKLTAYAYKVIKTISKIKLTSTHFFVSNSIFHLTFRLLRDNVSFRLKVAKKLLMT